MSIYNPSLLVDAQAKFLASMQAGEWRLPDTAVLSTMMNGEMTNPALSVVRKIESQTPKAYLPIRKAKGSGTTRAHNHTGDSGDSKEVSVTWQTYAETFGINMDRGLDNVFSFQEQYNADLRSCILNLLERHEANLLAKLKAEYTQINQGRILGGTWDATNYQMIVDNLKKDYFFQGIKTSMANNLYRNDIMVIADSLAFQQYLFQTAQGTGNAVNLAPLLNGMRVTNTSYEIDAAREGAAIAFSMGQCGIVPWIPVKNRKPLDPEKAMNSNVGDFGSFQVPVYDANGNVSYNLDFAISAYSARADKSQVGGSTQDIQLEIEVSLDVAFVQAPLSAARATGIWSGKTDSVIYGFGIGSSGTQS